MIEARDFNRTEGGSASGDIFEDSSRLAEAREEGNKGTERGRDKDSRQGSLRSLASLRSSATKRSGSAAPSLALYRAEFSLSLSIPPLSVSFSGRPSHRRRRTAVVHLGEHISPPFVGYFHRTVDPMTVFRLHDREGSSINWPGTV